MSITDNLSITQKRIGLTGNIASGKSTIAQYIADNKNLKVLNADNYSKEILNNRTDAYEKIINYFGNEILDHSSSSEKINLKFLKKIIFNNEKKRKWIENILHPLIKRKMVEDCIKYKNDKILILEIPLLFEAKFESICTEIWLIKCSRENQIKRLIDRDKISLDEAKKIMNIQSNNIKKEEKSQKIFENNYQDREKLFKKINELI
tara:strand:- start:99 stop:716 length:618 start_codon:yes stop_codon:yes gene_type:complete